MSWGGGMGACRRPYTSFKFLWLNILGSFPRLLFFNFSRLLLKKPTPRHGLLYIYCSIMGTSQFPSGIVRWKEKMPNKENLDTVKRTWDVPTDRVYVIPLAASRGFSYLF